MVAGLHRALEPLRRRMDGLVRRAVVRAVDDAGGRQTVQAEGLAGDLRDQREHFQPYGFSGHALPGAECLMLSVGGGAGHTVVIGVEDRRYRLAATQPGEVALYDDQGQVVHLTRDGIVIRSSNPITVEGQVVTVRATELARIEAVDVQIHATASLRLDCGGQGVTWTPSQIQAWQQGVTLQNMGAPSPPEHQP
jgi:phage baseplate assembly protein V